MSSSTRQTLIQRISNQSDEKSWEEFVKIYRPYIMGFMLKMGIEGNEVEDMTQKVILKLWKSIPTFEYKPGQCKFRSWLAIVSRNVIRDQARLKQNKLVKVIFDQTIPEPEVIAEIELTALEEWKVFISKLAWENIIQKYKPLEIEVFMQCAKNEINIVASNLGITVNTVYVYKRRIETAFKKEIYKLNLELG